MNIPPKYEDVVAQLAEATKELENYKSMDHNQLLALAAGEHLKSAGAENYTGVVFTIELDDGSHRYEVVVSTQKVDAVTVFEKLATLQQRLTVAEQRAGELREKLAYEESDHHTTQVSRDAWRAKYEDALMVIQEKDLLLDRSKNFVAFVHKCVRKNKEYAPLHWQEMVELDRDLSALKPAEEGEGS